MLAFAPITRIVDWLTTDDIWRELKRQVPSPLGLRALDFARSEIGKGEYGGNNKGPDLSRYRNGYGGIGAWCAAFVFWCLLQAARTNARSVPVKRTHGARKLFRRAVSAGRLVEYQDIQPGDLVLWARGTDGSWKAHIGIVSRVERNDQGEVVRWWYIAGNEGRYPALVREREGTAKRRRIGFARMG